MHQLTRRAQRRRLLHSISGYGGGALAAGRLVQELLSFEASRLVMFIPWPA